MSRKSKCYKPEVGIPRPTSRKTWDFDESRTSRLDPTRGGRRNAGSAASDVGCSTVLLNRQRRQPSAPRDVCRRPRTSADVARLPQQVATSSGEPRTPTLPGAEPSPGRRRQLRRQIDRPTTTTTPRRRQRAAPDLEAEPDLRPRTRRFPASCWPRCHVQSVFHTRVVFFLSVLVPNKVFNVKLDDLPLSVCRKQLRQ